MTQSATVLRRRLRAGCCALLGLIAVAMNSEAVDDASSDGLLESITGRAGDEVAKKIAEFKEPSGFNKGFVVGGLDFNADGTKLATNGQVAPPEVHVWEWRVPSHAPRILGMRSPA